MAEIVEVYIVLRVKSAIIYSVIVILKIITILEVITILEYYNSYLSLEILAVLIRKYSRK